MSRSPLFIRPALGLLAVVTAAVGLPGAARAEAADDCVLRSATHRSTLDEHQGCLNVSAELDAAPSVGETATITYEVRAAVADDAVRISVELPPNLRWRSAPAGTTLSSRESLAPQARGTVQRAELTRAFTAGESLRLTGTVTAAAAGPAEIQARATADTPTGTEAGGDDVLLTVAPAGQQSRLDIISSNRAAAVPYQGDAPVVDAAETKAAGGRLAPPPATERAPEPSDRSGEPAGERNGTEPAVTGTSCVTGTWNFIDNQGVGRAARQWQVQAWDDDSSTGSANDFLASSLTGFDGRYTLCFNSTDVGGFGSQDVYVVFFADNGYWRVQSPFGTYNYGSGVMWNVPTGTKEVGWLQPGDPTHMRGAHAFQAVSDAWNGTPGACWDLIGACRPVVVNWAPGSTDGTYYSGSDNQVHLAAADPDSRHTVVHEAGHSIMDDVFDDAYPSTPNCNPHYIPKTSSAGCAWSEGFAEWFPAQIYNDPFFRWPNGASINLETPTWGSLGWANGDRVEGRVAGALIDLADSHNEGTDQHFEGMYNIWSTFQKHNSPTFQQFWTDRSADGFSVGTAPLNSLFQNTIDY